ncbi:AAA family ATPase [Wohlfahrtiimonas chitiniclastica]|uniref:AAA family ATPase n=1 Tax=Wohlfahrtiimonas chitiniclastica TaxID=400946 RepID=UPI001BCE63C3|nr:AAA family ATPase [Wohlfahrtiimonas chitiniclastica]MBS7821115.1 AAA family ATPase [Wohlfahrtiimonas chitiniclastica]
MYIRKIEIENFRQLKDISIDIEEQLSLIIGKNNCGKTSILTAIDKLLNEKTISAYDFNLDFIKEIESKLVEEKHHPLFRTPKLK